MQVSYENTLDDLVAFNEYHARASGTLKRLTLGFVLAVVALTALTLLVAWRQDGGLRALTVGVTVVPVILVVALALLLLPRVLRAMIRSQLREGKNASLLGPRTLELDDDGLVERSETGENRTRWPGVEKVVSNERYLFVYLSAASAHVIPRGAFRDAGELEAFAAAVEQHCGRARAT